MPLDFGLLGGTPRINTPFENLSTILQVRNQQAAAQGLAEERQGRADERRMKAQQAQEEAQRAARYNALWNRKDPATGQPIVPTFEESAAEIGADNAVKVHKGYEEIKTAQWKTQQDAVQGVASILDGVEAWPKDDRQTPYTAARQSLIAKGLLTPKDAPEQYNASWVAEQMRRAQTAQQRFERDKAPADYTLGDSRISGATNQPVYTAPAAAPKADSFEAYLPVYLKERGIPQQAVTTGVMDAARRKFEASIRAPQQPDKPEDPLARRERELRIQKLEQELQKAANTPVNEKVEAIKPVLAEITKLAVGEKNPDGTYKGGIFKREGPAANIAGAMNRAGASANLNDDVRVYRSLVRGLTPMLARAVGHTGVLTEVDVERTEELFPSMGFLSSDGKTVAERKIAQFERLMAGQGTEEEKAQIRKTLGWNQAPGGKVTITSIKEIK